MEINITLVLIVIYILKENMLSLEMNHIYACSNNFVLLVPLDRGEFQWCVYFK